MLRYFQSFEKLATGEKAVINNIKDFAIDSRRDTSEHDCFGTVINIGQRQKIRAVYLDKRSESLVCRRARSIPVCQLQKHNLA